jgi:hypothetical protein
VWALIAVILLPCNTFVLLEKLVCAATGLDLANVPHSAWALYAEQVGGLEFFFTFFIDNPKAKV